MNRYRVPARWSGTGRALRSLRRHLLTHCEWCGGRSWPCDPVDWKGARARPRRRWWQGEAGLLHLDCRAVERAHRTCRCTYPMCFHGRRRAALCLRCGGNRDTDLSHDALVRLRILAEIPRGSRHRRTYEIVRTLARRERERERALR